MTANRIIHHIFNQPDIRHVAQADLERLVETYPYFAAARLLLAQKQFVQHPDLTAPLLKKAQLYSSNPQHLHQLLTETAVIEEATVAPEVHVPIAQVHTPSPVEIEELEDEISAEDQQILDEIEAEDRANAALAVQQGVITEHILIVEEEVDNLTAESESAIEEETAVETEIGTEEVEHEAEETVAAIEDKIVIEEETAVETEIGTEEEVEIDETVAAIEDEIITEEENTIEVETGTGEEAIAAESESTIEDKIVTEEETAVETETETEEVEAEITATEATPLIADEPGTEEEVEQALAAETSFQQPAAEHLPEEQDEIVAVDYEAIKAEKAFEKEKASDAPDEIVALDYEAIKAEKAFEEEKASDAPDEIVAIDYEAIKEDEETLKQYEPEIEEEEIVIAAEAAPTQTAGLAIPKAPEGAKQEVVTDDDELEEGPIRIHPIDTPDEETVLTFQPLYTEDYFAYKKLKDPNTAEMMNDKAQAEMRSFTDWLRELKDNFVAGKTTKDWYHQQMHRLYEDDEPEVSERVEKMAMESITLNDDIVSETLAEIWVRQHQHAKAIVIYQKLSLLNPDKNAYFAQKIKELQLLTDNNK